MALRHNFGVVKTGRLAREEREYIAAYQSGALFAWLSTKSLTPFDLK